MPQKVNGALTDKQKEGSYTLKTHQHKPLSYSFYIVCRDKDIQMEFKPHFYVGLDAVDHFVVSLKKEVAKLKKIVQRYPKVKDILWEDGQKEEFEAATCCDKCEGEFSDTLIKCQHHCHKTGKYLGALCKKCNFLEGQKFKIGCYFHNLRGYDGHLLCESSCIHADKDPRIIAVNREKYISQQFDDVIFLDS